MHAVTFVRTLLEKNSIVNFVTPPTKFTATQRRRQSSLLGGQCTEFFSILKATSWQFRSESWPWWPSASVCVFGVFGVRVLRSISVELRVRWHNMIRLALQRRCFDELCDCDGTRMSHQLDPPVNTPLGTIVPNRDDNANEPPPSSELKDNSQRRTPIWRCGAFAAEFADAIISNTDLEGGSIEGGEALMMSPLLLLLY